VTSSPGRREAARRTGLRGSSAAASHEGSLSSSPVENHGGPAGSGVRLLGRGGFGSVILGLWQGRRVAVKVINQRKLCDGVREANAVGLCHDNVAATRGIFETVVDGAPSVLVVMEYVGQVNLLTVIGKFPEKIDGTFVHRWKICNPPFASYVLID
jgi:serine/threonine protein kinase